MPRILVIAALVYFYGGTAFDGARPGRLDAAVRAFHDDINQSAREGLAVLRHLDQARRMDYLTPGIQRLAELPGLARF